jgi:hypothetical protein
MKAGSDSDRISLREAPEHARSLDLRQLVSAAWAMGIPTDGKTLEQIRCSVERWPAREAR